MNETTAAIIMPLTIFGRFLMSPVRNCRMRAGRVCGPSGIFRVAWAGGRGAAVPAAAGLPAGNRNPHWVHTRFTALLDAPQFVQNFLLVKEITTDL